MRDYNEESKAFIIDELMGIISDIKNGASIDNYYCHRGIDSYCIHANITPKRIFNDPQIIRKTIDEAAILSKAEEKKPKKRIYVDCGQCEHHTYDWDVDDGYGGEEYEICEKGHELYPKKCKDFEEL